MRLEKEQANGNFQEGRPQVTGELQTHSHPTDTVQTVQQNVLCERMTPYIMKHQSVDQAAYRKHYSTEDHLLTVSLLIEKSGEYNVPVWLALVDFEKAFDSVEHEGIWSALASQNVPACYIQLLRSLYAGQIGEVMTDKKTNASTLREEPSKEIPCHHYYSMPFWSP